MKAECPKSSTKAPKKTKCGAKVECPKFSAKALKKTKCCCGATAHTPCKCMEQGTACSRSDPKCACFALLSAQLQAML